jgi:molybdate transport system substrate-binding protein
MKLVSSVGVRPVLEELIPQFEKSSGHKVEILFGTAVQQKAKVDAGESFDLLILNPPQVEDLVKAGKVAGASVREIARAGMGFAIAANAPTPDISSDDKLRAYLRATPRLASGNPAVGGFGSVYFDRLVERLGIAGETRPKTQHQPPGDFAKPVSKGAADVGVGLLSEIAGVPNVKSVTLNPDDPASWVRFSAGMSVAPSDAAGAKALIAYLATPAATAVFNAKGLVT